MALAKDILSKVMSVQEKMNSMKKLCMAGMRALISVTLIGVIVYLFRDRLGDVALLIRDAHKGILLCVAVAGVGNCLFFALRLKTLLSVHKIYLNVYQSFVVVMLGFFCNNLVPSVVGSDIVKGVYVSKVTGKIKESASAILVDRLIGFVTLIITVVVALCVQSEMLQNKTIVYTVLTLIVICGVATFFFMNKSIAGAIKPLIALLPFKKFHGKIHDAYHAVHEYTNHPVKLGVAMIFSFMLQIVAYVLIYLCAYAMGLDIPMLMFFVFLPIISIASLAPSVNGLGVREAMFVYLFSRYCGAEGALAISVMMALLYVFLGVVGGLVFAISGGLTLKELRSVDAEGTKL